MAGLAVAAIGHPSPASAEHQMEITRVGSLASTKGPADWFTGAVRVDPLFDRGDPARVSGASVTFEPGARTAWHTHPLGQTLIVTSGCGWAQRQGGPVEEIRPGDVVWFPSVHRRHARRLPRLHRDPDDGSLHRRYARRARQGDRGGAGRPVGKPEEIAAAVIWLWSDPAASMIGHAMVIDGGQTVQ